MEDRHTVTVSDGIIPAFIISLDNVDLNLLPKWRSWKKDGTIPLWRAQSSGPGVEYLEFEVLAGDDEGSGDDQYENASSKYCYVCGVEVLVAYWNKHASSIRHKACSSIETTYLDRSRKQLSVVPELCAQLESTFYCPTCCATIVSTEQSTHERSKQHSQSVLYEGLLESLAKLYQDQNNFTQVCKEISAALFDPKNVQKFENGNTPETQADNVDKLKSVVINIETDTDTKTDDAIVLIEAESGAKLLVNFDNYHGLYTVGKETQCRVCRILVGNKLEHVQDIEHKKKADKPKVKDRNCIRPLNHFLNHCILCNEIIENPEAHILCSEKHITLLQEAMIEDDTKIDYTKEILSANFIEEVDFNKDLYFCKICVIYFPKPAMIEHIANQVHIKYLESSNAGKTKTVHKDNVNINEAQTKPVSTSITTNCITNGFCYVCNVEVPEHPNNVQEHLNGWFHNDNVRINECQTQPNLNSTTSYIVNGFCNVCKVKVPQHPNNIQEHLNGWFHNDNVKISEPVTEPVLSYIATSQIENGFCNVCKVNVPQHPHNIQEHLNGWFHNDNVKISEPVTEPVLSYIATSQIENGFCNVCKVNVPQHPHNIQEHLNGWFHNDNVKIYEPVTEPVPSYMTTSHIENGFCNVCKVNVPQHPHNIQEHLNGWFHNDNVKIYEPVTEPVPSYMTTSHIENGFCNVCKVNVPQHPHNIQEHLNGWFHRDNLYRASHGYVL